MDIDLHKVFSVPVVHFKLTNHRDDLFEELHKLEKKNCSPEAWLCSLNTSFGLPDEHQNAKPAALASLKNAIEKDAAVCLQALGLPNNVEVCELWYNIYHQRQNQEPHHHVMFPMPCWSGVYFYKNVTNLDATVFQNPISALIASWDRGYTSELFSECCARVFTAPVSDGDVLLFPAFLSHFVPPREEDTSRITFAFNLQFKQQENQHDA